MVLVLCTKKPLLLTFFVLKSITFELYVYYQTFNTKRRAGNEKDYETPGGADK
jgi:hypothetical protein